MALNEQEEFELLSLEREKSSFAQTPGGAATGVQRAPRLLSPLGEAGASIAGAGGMGAVLGAAAPEVLTGIAGGLRQFPQGARVAPLVESAAIAAKAAGRPTTALAGGISGLASETAGQAVDPLKSPLLSEGTRFAAGALTPEASSVGRFVIDVWKKKLPTTLESSALKNLAMKVAAKLEGRPQDIDAEEAAFLNKLVTEFRGGAPSETSQRGVYDILQSGAKTRLALGETEAQTILDNANRSIKKEITDAQFGPVAYAGKAQERIAQRGRDALAVSQQQRSNVGDIDVTSSDIGGSLRNVIVGRNQAAIEARRGEYQAAEAARDVIVQQKEAAGNFVSNTPEYSSLLQSLKDDAAKRSPDVQKALNNILAQVSKQENKPAYFQQIDDVRRQLGEVFRGNPPEGYAAIDAATARKYYGLLSDIQKKYAGEPQEKLLKQYAEASEGLDVFGSKAGRRMTAVDRYDDTRFQTDAAALPKQFFNTRQGVQDLVELTGNREAVVKAARDFAATELRDLSESQVRKWMTDRREMLAALPEVRTAVTKYANSLQYGESVSRAAEGGVKRLQAYSMQQERAAQGRASAIESEAATRAGQARTQRGEEAISLLGPRGEMFPVQRVKALIEGGNSQQWATAAPHILASPGGKEMLADAVKQTLADRALTSTKGLGAFFDDNIRPALSATRLMNETDQSLISKQLTAIENMKLPEQEKLGMARRVILQAFAGYASSGAARGATGLAALIPGAPEPKPVLSSQQPQPVLSPLPPSGVLRPGGGAFVRG